MPSKLPAWHKVGDYADYGAHTPSQSTRLAMAVLQSLPSKENSNGEQYMMNVSKFIQNSFKHKHEIEHLHYEPIV